MTAIFLSYRRDDTEGAVGRLSDSLKRKLGRKTVFRDVSDIQPGADFEKELEQRIENASVVLAMIGPNWLEILSDRLKSTDIDYLRFEIATALSENKRVIPVLLKGGTLPSAEALPGDLERLAGRQAMTLRDEAWDHDIDRLVDAIGRPYRWGWLVGRIVLAVFAILMTVWLVVPHLVEGPTTDYRILQRAFIYMLGAYALVECVIGYLYFRHLRQKRAP